MPIIINHAGFAESNALVPHDTGWVNCATFGNMSSGFPWVNPGDAITQDGLYTGGVTGSSGVTQYLSCTGPTWTTVPASATIDGIQIRYSPSTALGLGLENSVLLIVGGVLSGTEHSTGQIYLGAPSGHTHVKGTSSDLWGLTPTPADVNASNFGIGIRATVSGSGFGTIWLLDNVQMRLFYTA